MYMKASDFIRAGRRKIFILGGSDKFSKSIGIPINGWFELSEIKYGVEVKW